MGKTNNDLVYSNIFDNISYLRKKHHLSKKAMAQKLNVSVYTINLLENRIMPKRCSARMLFRAHKEFGVWIFNPLYTEY